MTSLRWSWIALVASCLRAGQVAPVDSLPLDASFAFPADGIRSAEVEAPWEDLGRETGSEWRVEADPRTGRFRSARGAGLRFHAWPVAAAPTVGELDAAFGRLLEGHPLLTRTAELDLRLEPSESAVARGGEKAVLRYSQWHAGLPVRGARLEAWFDRGVLTWVDAIGIGDVTSPTVARVGEAAALAAAQRRLGREVAPAEAPVLVLLPHVAGDALEHELAWSLILRERDGGAPWQVDVSAVDGRVLGLASQRHDVTGHVRGGARIEGAEDGQRKIPLPNVIAQAMVSPPWFSVSNAAGTYDYRGGTAFADFATHSDWVRLSAGVNCAGDAYREAADPPGTGDMDWGFDDDCATSADPGNTPGARTAWLAAQSMRSVFTAYNPSRSRSTCEDTPMILSLGTHAPCGASEGACVIEFGPDGWGCRDTAESVDIVFHEMGHEYGGTLDYASEAIPDAWSFLMTHSPCVGRGLTEASCPPRGCAAPCDGIRDVSVRNAEGRGAADDLALDPTWDFSDERPDGGGCRMSPPVPGLTLGFEPHAESLIASGILWDLAQNLEWRLGRGAGWERWTTLFTNANLTNALGSDAYAAVVTGACPTDPAKPAGGFTTVSTTDPTRWYAQLVRADDDDGSALTPSPDECAIFAAFSAHGVDVTGDPPACCGTASAPRINGCGAPCLLDPPDVTIHGFASADVVHLTWPAVSGATSYDVYRGIMGCDAVMVPVARGLTCRFCSFTDSEASADLPMTYAVQARSATCSSPFSACRCSRRLTQVSAGATHVIGLMDDGSAWCWGANDRGQLGDGTWRPAWSEPVRVVRADGSPLMSVVEVAAGENHGLARLIDGSVWAWGDDSAGQLGLGTSGSAQPFARPVLAGATGSGRLASVTSIAAGGEHSLARLRSGRVVAWGSNAFQQLGDGSRASRSTPVFVRMSAAAELADVTAIAAGQRHSMALVAGVPFTWGSNDRCQLGSGGATPATRGWAMPVVGPGASQGPLTSVTRLAQGSTSNHCLVIRSISGVDQPFAWGSNSRGQCGGGGLMSSRVPRPVAVDKSDGGRFDDVVLIAVGGEHSLATDSSSTAFGWGDDAQGQRGTTSTTSATSFWPFPVVGTGPSGRDGLVTFLAAGRSSSFAMASDRTIAWGRNAEGELMDGTAAPDGSAPPMQSNVPVRTNVTCP